MHNLVITQGGETVVMPPTRDLQVGGEEVAKRIVMGNGKEVKEIVGHRPIVTASWDWVPGETLADLHLLLRHGGFFEVDYLDPSGEEQHGSFSIGYPQSKVFKFEPDGSAVWHRVDLTMRSQEVV